MKHPTRWWVPSILITVAYLIRHGLLSLLDSYGDKLLPYRPTFAFASTIFAAFNLPRWMSNSANFDGVYYLTLAQNGYKSINFSQAFFPVFPFFLLHPIFSLFHNQTIAFLISMYVVRLCFVLFLIVFFYLIKKQFGRQIAWYTILTILVFPTSTFFGTFYSESLFMLLCALCFLASLYQRWWLAGIFALIASATRLVGAALVPALLLEVWISYNKRPLQVPSEKLKSFLIDHWQHLLAVSVGMLGLLAYCFYLQQMYYDAFLFMHVQESFNTGRSSDLILYPQVIWRYFKILATVRPFDLKYYAYVQEFIAGTLGLVLILWAATKVRLSYTLFALIAFFIPTLTGTFSSMPRYLLVCFPIYIILGKFFSQHPKLAIIWYPISFLWLMFNTLLFIQGYWVA